MQALYLDELGRAGAKSELDFWVSTLNTPGQTQQQDQAAIASDIENSQEAQDNIVKSWYVSYLGRQTLGGEEQVWVNLLQQGQTQEQVLSQILGGSEFYARAQNLFSTGNANENYVEALYQVLLGRTGDSSGVAGWVSDLPSIGGQGVALDFLQGQEFRTDQFEGYYNALLHRPDDPNGLNGWIFSNVDMASVRVGFEATSEFFNNG